LALVIALPLHQAAALRCRSWLSWLASPHFADAKWVHVGLAASPLHVTDASGYRSRLRPGLTSDGLRSMPNPCRPTHPTQKCLAAQRGHIQRVTVCIDGLQRLHAAMCAAMVCSNSMQQQYAATACNKDLQRRHAATAYNNSVQRPRHSLPVCSGSVACLAASLVMHG